MNIKANEETLSGDITTRSGWMSTVYYVLNYGRKTFTCCDWTEPPCKHLTGRKKKFTPFYERCDGCAALGVAKHLPGCGSYCGIMPPTVPLLFGFTLMFEYFSLILIAFCSCFIICIFLTALCLFKFWLYCVLLKKETVRRLAVVNCYMNKMWLMDWSCPPSSFLIHHIKIQFPKKMGK